MAEYIAVPIEEIKFPEDTCMNSVNLLDKQCEKCQYDGYAKCENAKKRHLKKLKKR